MAGRAIQVCFYLHSGATDSYQGDCHYQGCFPVHRVFWRLQLHKSDPDCHFVSQAQNREETRPKNHRVHCKPTSGKHEISGRTREEVEEEPDRHRDHQPRYRNPLTSGEPSNEEKLRALVEAAKTGENCKFLNVEPSITPLTDVLSTSGIINKNLDEAGTHPFTQQTSEEWSQKTTRWRSQSVSRWKKRDSDKPVWQPRVLARSQLKQTQQHRP